MLPLSEVPITFTSLTVSERFPNFFLRTSEVFTVSDSIVFLERDRRVNSIKNTLHPCIPIFNNTDSHKSSVCVCVCGQKLTYFLRACFNASDSSSFLASSRNFFMLSFISLFLFSSVFRLSRNSPRKPFLPPPRSPDKYLTCRRGDRGTLLV